MWAGRQAGRQKENTDVPCDMVLVIANALRLSVPNVGILALECTTNPFDELSTLILNFRLPVVTTIFENRWMSTWWQCVCKTM